MRGRDAVYLVGGLLLGAVLGVLMASAGVVNLSGTAAVNPPVRQAYYSLDLVETQSLLTAAYPEEADALLAALTRVSLLTTADDFPAAFTELEPDVQWVTERAFQAVAGVAPDPQQAEPPVTAPDGLVSSLADGLVKTCLGLDSNPYNPDGAQVFLAIEVPETQIDQFPEGWQAYRLDVPKEGELFWQALSCRQAGGGSSERSR
jgi:hypothetical protein